MQNNVIAFDYDSILKLAARLPEDERQNLVRDPSSSSAIASDDGRLIAGGADISVLLYAGENDRLLELEYIRWDGQPILRPSLSTLQVI